MKFLLHVAFFIQVIGWAFAENLYPTSDAPVPSSYSITTPQTSLKPMLPIIICSALGGFFGFLLLVFGGLYLLRRRRTKDVDNVIESAHFPTMAYNSSNPATSPALSANSREYNSYIGYLRGEKSEDNAPFTPPGLPVPVPALRS